MDIDLRRTQTEFALSFNLTLEEYLKVVRSCSSTEVTVVLELMKAKKPRTNYRAYAQTKVRRWLDGNFTGKPLSGDQFKHLAPRYPVHWSLPK